jgi:S1-C subfamily serine protease
MKRTAANLLILLFVAVLLGAGIFLGYWYGRRSEGVIAVRTASVRAPFDVRVDTQPLADPGLIADAAARVEPSVVTIDTEYRPRSLYSDDMFGFTRRLTVHPRGTGSGVILSPDGVIVTNNHVVQNASKIQVTLADGREFEGTVVGTDPQSDLAVVRVPERNLPAVTFADSDAIRTGEWVEAIGNPLRVGTTVTAGIVSAVRKKDASPNGKGYPTDVIQTDAAINPGNSGGALADIKGRLIGINTAILSTSGGNIGIGFAIPSNTVRAITTQLIDKGRVIRPWFGISFGPITARARSALNLPAELSGVIVGSIVSNSPAEAAGIKPNDVIRDVNGVPVTSPQQLQNQVQSMKVGDSLRISYWRNGTNLKAVATLREQPKVTASQIE